MAGVEIVEIDGALLPEVGRFLERAIGRRTTAADFSAALARRWAAGPVGFALVVDGTVAGALGTIRSTRIIRGRPRAFCNLTSFAVDPAFRSFALALLRRATACRDVVYTNFTASDAVVDLLKAFGFTALPARERILLPWARAATDGASVTTDPDTVAEWMARSGSEAAAFVADHRGTALRWVAIDLGGERCAIAMHRMSARRVPLDHVVYASAPQRLAVCAPIAARASRRAWGFALLAWPEWQFGGATASFAVRRPRPVMIRSDDIEPSDIDALYSELTLFSIQA